jgi:hypothetical protein
MPPSEQHSLATLQQQIHDSIERIRQTINEAKGLLWQYNEHLDVVSLELIRTTPSQEDIA